jgi:hypothetical protein
MVGASRRRFERDGLGYWSVRDAEGGPVVGRGGCSGPDDAVRLVFLDRAPHDALVAGLAERARGPDGLVV